MFSIIILSEQFCQKCFRYFADVLKRFLYLLCSKEQSRHGSPNNHVLYFEYHVSISNQNLIFNNIRIIKNEYIHILITVQKGNKCSQNVIHVNHSSFRTNTQSILLHLSLSIIPCILYQICLRIALRLVISKCIKYYQMKLIIFKKLKYRLHFYHMKQFNRVQ